MHTPSLGQHGSVPGMPWGLPQARVCPVSPEEPAMSLNQGYRLSMGQSDPNPPTTNHDLGLWFDFAQSAPSRPREEAAPRGRGGQKVAQHAAPRPPPAPVTGDLCGEGVSGRAESALRTQPWGRPPRGAAGSTQGTAQGQAHIKGVFIQAAWGWAPSSTSCEPRQIFHAGAQGPCQPALNSHKAPPEQLAETGRPSSTFPLPD